MAQNQPARDETLGVRRSFDSHRLPDNRIRRNPGFVQRLNRQVANVFVDEVTLQCIDGQVAGSGYESNALRSAAQADKRPVHLPLG